MAYGGGNKTDSGAYALYSRTPSDILYFPEQIVLVFALIAVTLFYYLNIPLRDPFGLYWNRVSSIILTYFVSLVVCMLCYRLFDLTRARKTATNVNWSLSFSRFFKDFLRLSVFIRDLRMLHAVCVLFVVFINLKHLIPYLNSRIYDDILLMNEKSLFGGKLLGEFLHDLLGLGVAPQVLSKGYTLFYPYSAILVYIFVLQRKSYKLTEEFLSAFALVWFIGILIVYVFPTLGPCFYVPELFQKLPFTYVTQMQLDLLKHKEFLLRNPKGEYGVYLISGLPSLHLAVPILASVYLKKLSSSLAFVSWIFVVVTAITTLYFGWHYFHDDVAAVVLVCVVIWIVKNRFAERQ